METNTLKFELDNICRGCLSADRNLKPLSKDCAVFFLHILGTENIVPEDSIYFNLLLCWECTFALRKILKYQKRFKRSQIVFLREWVGPFSVESLSLLTTFKKTNYDTSLIYDAEEIKDTKIDINIDKTEFEIKDEKTYHITIKEEITNDFAGDISKNNDSDDFVDDIPKNNDSDDFDDDIPKNKDSDVFVDIFEEKEVQKEKKYYSRGQCKKTMKCSQVNYDTGIDRHIESVELKIEHIKDIISKGKNKTKDSMLAKMFIATKEIINTMNSDLKQDETNANGVKCSHCEMYVPNLNLLKEHWSEHTLNAIKCIYCDRMSIYNTEMSKHLKSSHKYSFKCECGYVCRHRKTYFLHFRKYHSEFVCDHCTSRFNKKENIEKHMRQKHLPNKCELCGRVYSRKSSLQAHYWTFHKEFNRQTSELTYCVECDMQFENHFLYNRHLKTVVAHKPRTPKKFPCSDCGKIFTKNIYMVKHYNLVHKKKTDFYCEICDKYFSSAFSIQTHTKYVHLKEEKMRDKMCQICGKYFFTNSGLKKHTRTHTGERPYKCRYCDSTFTQGSSRRTHERTHHKNVE